MQYYIYVVDRNPDIVNVTFSIPRGTGEGIKWLISLCEDTPKPTQQQLLETWVQERFEAEVKKLPRDVQEARIAEMQREADAFRQLAEE